MLLAMDTDDSMDDNIALLSRFPSAAALYESGAQTPKRMEAAAASTPATHVVAKIKPLSRWYRGAGSGDVLMLEADISADWRGEGAGFILVICLLERSNVVISIPNLRIVNINRIRHSSYSITSVRRGVVQQILSQPQTQIFGHEAGSSSEHHWLVAGAGRSEKKLFRKVFRSFLFFSSLLVFPMVLFLLCRKPTKVSKTKIGICLSE